MMAARAAFDRLIAVVPLNAQQHAAATAMDLISVGESLMIRHRRTLLCRFHKRRRFLSVNYFPHGDLAGFLAITREDPAQTADPLTVFVKAEWPHEQNEQNSSGSPEDGAECAPAPAFSEVRFLRDVVHFWAVRFFSSRSTWTSPFLS
jgi:hypothetical protein